MSPYVRHYPSAACIVFVRALSPPPPTLPITWPTNWPIDPLTFFPVEVRRFLLLLPAYPVTYAGSCERNDLMQNPIPPLPLRPLHKHTYISYRRDVFAQYMKPESIFADCQANRTVLLFL